jgi:hypothetical protein
MPYVDKCTRDNQYMPDSHMGLGIWTKDLQKARVFARRHVPQPGYLDIEVEYDSDGHIVEVNNECKV